MKNKKKKLKNKMWKALIKALAECMQNNATPAPEELTYDDLRKKILEGYNYQVKSDRAESVAETILDADKALIVLNSFEALGLPPHLVADDIICFTEMGPHPLSVLQVDHNENCVQCKEKNKAQEPEPRPENN